MIRPYRAAHHAGADGPAEEERPLEVGVDHLLPGRVFHPKHQAVAGDAGVVDQDMNPLEFRLDLVDNPLDILGVGDVDGIAFGRAAGFADRLQAFLQALRACGRRRRPTRRRPPARRRSPGRCRATRPSRAPPAPSSRLGSPPAAVLWPSAMIVDTSSAYEVSLSRSVSIRVANRHGYKRRCLPQSTPNAQRTAVNLANRMLDLPRRECWCTEPCGRCASSSPVRTRPGPIS